jgi:hypothetical protein
MVVNTVVVVVRERAPSCSKLWHLGWRSGWYSYRNFASDPPDRNILLSDILVPGGCVNVIRWAGSERGHGLLQGLMALMPNK